MPRAPISLACLVILAGTSALAKPAPPSAPLERILKKELSSRNSVHFDELLGSWQKEYGSQVVPPLFKLALAKDLEDPSRYVALMGAVKLGGPETAKLLQPFLKDKSWMLRSGALRALSALKNKETSHWALPLLKDPSLIVRCDAVEAVRELSPAGAREALIGALKSEANYHGGKAQWVPGKALAALVALHEVEAAPEILPLLSHHKDPELQHQALSALESLTAQKFAGPIPKQIQNWEQFFSKR